MNNEDNRLYFGLKTKTTSAKSQYSKTTDVYLKNQQDIL